MKSRSCINHVFLGAICGASLLGRASDSPRTIYDEAKRSTFLIETFDAKGIPLSLGTGFAVRSNYLASNCHVIRGAHRVTAKNLDSGRTFHVEAIVGSDLRADLILLRIAGAATPLLIDTNFVSSVGDSVYALGNPRGLEGTFSAGIISATRELDKVHYLQMTAPISPGSSGGPILSSGGKVIGVATAAVKEAQNLNFAVSAQHLAALLAVEPQEETFAGFSAKQKDFARKQEPAHQTSGDELAIRDFEWTPTSSFGVSSGRPFTFTVFNGLSRPIRKVLVVVSFLNADSDPVETKFIRIPETIAPESAHRSKASVDDSVYRLSKLPDPQHPQFDAEGTDKTEYNRTFTLGTNSIKVKWKGRVGEGFKPSYSINGKSATKAEYQGLFTETEGKLRVMRVLSFEFAD